MTPELPKFYVRLFRWLCEPTLYEELQGDLEEGFLENFEANGLKKARKTYRKEVIKMIRPSVLKHAHLFNKHIMTLPKNYLKTSIRAIKLHPFYVAANVFGLALALSICMIGYFNYRFNATFNANFAQADELYKIHGVRTGEAMLGRSSMALGPALVAEGFEAARYKINDLAVKDGTRLFNTAIGFVDPEFLEFFNIANATKQQISSLAANEIVISPKLAMKLYNEAYPVGKLVEIVFPNKREASFVIVDVFDELPTNTSFYHSALININTYLEVYGLDGNDWERKVDATFVHASKAELAQLKQNLAELKPIRNANNPKLTIASFHLDTILEWPAFEDGLYGGRFNQHLHPSSVYGISGSALTILLLACFNFINTSIALSGKRLKEIAVRKIMGGTQRSTASQFFIENSFMILLAVILSFGISAILVPSYNALFERELIQLDKIPFGDLLTFSAWIIVIVSILSAAYPSLYVSKFSAINIFRKKVSLSGKNRLMAILLTFQFALCFYNVFGLFLNYENAVYQKTLDRGYDVQAVVNIPLNRSEQYQLLEDRLNQSPLVEQVAGASWLIGFSNETEFLQYEGIDQSVTVLRVGMGYQEALGLRLLKGSFFKSDQNEDVEIVVNRMLEEQYGEDLLHQSLTINEQKFRVVGVVEDFNVRSIMMDNKIEPTVIKLAIPGQYNYAAARINGSPDVALRELEKVWYEVFPQELYNGFLQNSVLQGAEKLNEVMLTINLFLAIITILVSVLGLYTLISLKVQRKSKEFGIRKVLGATKSTIIHLLGKDLYWMIGIASIIGLVSSMQVFQTVFDIIYAYHIDPNLSHFLKSILVVLLIIVLTIGLKVYRTSNINPSQQLRSE